MTVNDEAKIALVKSLDPLMQRVATTTDPAEKVQALAAIQVINGQIADIDAADLNAAAASVATASDALEAAIAKAKKGPFDNYLAAAQASIDRLQAVGAHINAAVKLPPAPLAVVEPEAAAAPAAAGVPPINPATNFAAIRDEYQTYFDCCEPAPAKATDLQQFSSRLLKGKPTYEATGSDLGVPWYFIGIIHGLECGFSFSSHLYNGDPLTARTVHVPTGLPATGTPPFTWQESARDALRYQGFANQADWSLPRILSRLEAYNGEGYRQRRLPSPYLWSFSNLYERGKFTSDGHFDPNAVSRQCGGGVIIRMLVDNNQVAI